MSEGNQAGAAKDSATPPTRRRRGEKQIPKGEMLAGNFLIEDMIGEGGMAIVYAARQKSLNRVVAVKVLHSRFARDPEFVRRFEAESGALASLNHPNVVNIIDRGHDGDRYFFIMENVHGRTLDQHIIDNTLGMKEWRAVVAACRDALEYVHKRGVVHRDIKPSNILIGPDMMVKIGDFGIAHLVGLVGDTSDQSISTTPQARAMGTANYMAPEQTTDPASVDHRADVYSLGVTFYKMLARALPVGDDYPMPSEANHDVPVAVDAVIRRSMAADRNQRYQSVKEFCDDLLAALKEQTVSITSVLNYRNSPTPVNALYTGADFRSQPVPSGTSKPGKGATPAPLKGLTPKPVKKDSKEVPKTTPRPAATSDIATAAKTTPKPKNTPRPAGPTGATPPPAPADAHKGSENMLKMVAIGATVIVLLLVAAIVMVVAKGQSPKSSGAPLDPSVPISEQQKRLREEILKEKENVELPPLEGAFEQRIAAERMATPEASPGATATVAPTFPPTPVAEGNVPEEAP